VSNDNPLSKPTLKQLRTHQIGKFFEIVDNDQKITKTVTHPRWFESPGNVKQMEISLSEEVYEILMSDGKVSGRWKDKRPRWVPGYKSDTGKGYYKYHVRTPKGKEIYVDIKNLERYRTPKKNVGRRPGGMAYKLRREVWRALEGIEYTTSLLRDKELFEKSRAKTRRVSIILPDLTLALLQFLKMDLIKNLKDSEHFILEKWKEYRDVRTHFFQDNLKIKDLKPHELDKFLEVVTEKHWKAIVARLVELRILKDKQQGKISSNKDSIQIFEVKIVDDPTDFKCQECQSFDWTYDLEKGEICCGRCGLVVEEDPEPARGEKRFD
jgi:hypothetical protein